MKLYNSVFPPLCFTTKVDVDYENWLQVFNQEPNELELEKMNTSLTRNIPLILKQPINNPNYGREEGA